MTRGIWFSLLLPSETLVLALLGCEGGRDDTTVGDGDADADGDVDADGDADGACTRGTFEGDYTISDATSLEGLAGYMAVTGDLVIGAGSYGSEETFLTSVDGLECLQDIGGRLEINGWAPCPRGAGGCWGDYSNPALASLAGLSGLRSIGGSLAIWGNAGLATLDGLDGLESISGDLTIWFSGLTNLDGLSALTSVGGSLVLAGNDALASLTGLEGASIAANVSIGAMDDREDNPFPPVGNGSLRSLDGLGGVTSVGGDLTIYGNDVLTNLDALAGLTSVSGGLEVAGNGSLATLDGLDGITSVGGDICIGRVFLLGHYSAIVGNDILENLDALGSVTELGGDLTALNNILLPTCEATLLADRLAALGWAGQRNIRGNDDAGVCE